MFGGMNFSRLAEKGISREEKIKLLKELLSPILDFMKYGGFYRIEYSVFGADETKEYHVVKTYDFSEDWVNEVTLHQKMRKIKTLRSYCVRVSEGMDLTMYKLLSYNSESLIDAILGGHNSLWIVYDVELRQNDGLGTTEVSTVLSINV